MGLARTGWQKRGYWCRAAQCAGVHLLKAAAKDGFAACRAATRNRAGVRTELGAEPITAIVGRRAAQCSVKLKAPVAAGRRGLGNRGLAGKSIRCSEFSARRWLGRRWCCQDGSRKWQGEKKRESTGLHAVAHKALFGIDTTTYEILEKQRS